MRSVICSSLLTWRCLSCVPCSNILLGLPPQALYEKESVIIEHNATNGSFSYLLLRTIPHPNFMLSNSSDLLFSALRWCGCDQLGRAATLCGIIAKVTCICIQLGTQGTVKFLRRHFKTKICLYIVSHYSVVESKFITAWQWSPRGNSLRKKASVHKHLSILSLYHSC